LPCRIPFVTLAWIVLGFVLVVAFVLWRLLMTAARWSREMIELQEHGIEVTGVVLNKVTYRARGGHSRYLRYEYVDRVGARHGRKVLVTDEAWDTLEEGSPITVVYSERRPEISAPRYLLGVMEKGQASNS